MCYPFNEDEPLTFKRHHIEDLVLAREEILELIRTVGIWEVQNVRAETHLRMGVSYWTWATLTDGRHGFVRALITLSQNIYEHQLAMLEGL